MCLHSKSDVNRAMHGSDHSLGRSFWGVLWLESTDGQVKGVNCIDVRETQQVADAIHNIQEYWHRETREWTVHLEHVNLQRWAHGLPMLTVATLPHPSGQRYASRDAQASARA